MKKGHFQTILVIVFMALAGFGILVFSGAIQIGKNKTPGSLGTVVLWGTVRSSAISEILQKFNNANTTFAVEYVEKSADTYDQDLLEALADGTGPDMFFMPDDLTFHYSNKIVNIPYSSYPLATFKNNFAGAGEVFLSSKGVLAFPISIDPLMMYYNRSMLDANGVIFPPATWDDLVGLVPTLTKKDDSNKIIKSAVALGQSSNIVHAKDILTALFMQASSPIVTEQDGRYYPNFNTTNPKYNLVSVLQFYTSFADPSKEAYSWNRSFPNSNEAFSSEDVAFYFGFASELTKLINSNPNQNFGVAPLPQIKNADIRLTNAHVTGIAIFSTSKKISTAFTAASLLSTGDFASEFAIATGTVPARRDLLKDKPTTDAFSPIFYNSALYGRSWVDPSSADTDNIFRNLIDSVLSNTIAPQSAILDASSRLNLLFVR